jgi:erythronate-4-phosphate dehydrogenase
MRILADTTLPHLESLFNTPFELTTYQNEEGLLKHVASHDILLCRSTLHVTADTLKNTSIKCVATASSGVDHIDKAYLDANDILLIDAKGSNAEAVADYVVATLAWLKKQHHLHDKKAGIIGAGFVGEAVASRLNALSFEIMHYDPLRAQHDYSFQSCALEDLFTCDQLFIHANLHDTRPFPSYHLINQAFLTQLKPNTIIINAARGGIVDENALLNHASSIIYCTDVYDNEPFIHANTIEMAHLCTPHIAGHSIEAKLNAIELVAQKIHDHYHLPHPQSLIRAKPVVKKRALHESWDDYVLRLYDPSHDTTCLKNSLNKEQTFLTLRRAHQHRHDFRLYTEDHHFIITP